MSCFSSNAPNGGDDIEENEYTGIPPISLARETRNLFNPLSPGSRMAARIIGHVTEAGVVLYVLFDPQLFFSTNTMSPFCHNYIPERILFVDIRFLAIVQV